MSRSETDGNRYILQSVDNALKIIELLTDYEELSYAEMSAHLGLGKSTVFRLVATLESHKFVTRSESSKIRLSFKMAAIGGIVYNRSELIRTVHPYLVELAQRTSCTAHLVAMTEPVNIQFLDKVLPRASSIPMASSAGYTTPAHLTATGKAILAQKSQRDVDDYIAKVSFYPATPNSIMDAGQLRDELKWIREHGFAIDREESESGLVCFAAPILDSMRSPWASISISGFRDRMYMRQEELSQLIMETAQRINQEIC